MTSPVSGSSDVAAKIAAMATAGTPAPQATSTESKSKTEVDKDMFLKLLVAQLKYQDPTKPADTTQFLAQTAQFTVVEKLSELSKQQSEMVTAQLMNSATNLIGRTVTYTDEKGRPAHRRRRRNHYRQQPDAQDREHGCCAVAGQGSPTHHQPVVGLATRNPRNERQHPTCCVLYSPASAVCAHTS
jgi:flagellar basal-body rod modification protein FlgD